MLATVIDSPPQIASDVTGLIGNTPLVRLNRVAVVAAPDGGSQAATMPLEPASAAEAMAADATPFGPSL